MIVDSRLCRKTCYSLAFSSFYGRHEDRPLQKTGFPAEPNTNCCRCHARRCAFTLLELLVVTGIMALLLSMLIPSLASARQQAKSVVCRSNIRQVLLANGYYAQDHMGVYCPGAADFLKNLHRWHGQRDHPSEAFDSSRGPLVDYLGPEATIRQCPSFPADKIAEESGGFERGNGGYGYNNAYIGVRVAGESENEYVIETDQAGAWLAKIQRPGETIMFADSAFAGHGLIEYSFAEPRFHPRYPLYRAAPSIQFRHRGTANVGWCDGHVDSHRQTFTHKSPFYPTDPKRFEIGWFGQSDSNKLFDLR